MTLQRYAFIAIVTFISVTIYGQLFHPLGLGTGLGEQQGIYSQPRMHVEGNILYVCTSQGLYSKDISGDDSEWQLAGFEGVPLQDYVRRGSDMLALRYNNGGNFLLLSHDGGKTYEDVTPEILCQEKYEVLPSLAQHPSDPNTLLVSSIYWGIFRSTDFGQTWENLIEHIYGNTAASFIGFHPAQPSIIFNSGEGYIFEGHINISYDGGQTWNDHGASLGFPGDNCVHRPAFNPTNPDRWIVGGEGVVYTSNDNGYTWSTQNYWGDTQRSAYWYFTEYDNENSDVVYMAGNGPSEIMIMCSADGGESWPDTQIEPNKKEIERVNDILQYGDKLLIYTESDVYEILKSELLAQALPVRNMTSATSEESSESYDLSGRCLSTPPAKGVYIENGRKKLNIEH